MKLTRVLIYYLIIPLFFFMSTQSWSADNTTTVSYLEGPAFKSKDGKDWKPLLRGDYLGANESVKTGLRTRLELTLPDGSKVRFSENTLFKVESLLVTEEERRFEMKAIFGKVWFKVKKYKKLKKISVYEVKTATAVAGVRGTTFRIDANEDLSSLVKVYEGEVSVNSLPTESEDKGTKPKYISGPKEVKGPHEVSREEWSYIVKSWQQIAVSPEGAASKPVSFSPEEDKSDWVLWNQEMDKE
ncbi:MAG: putative periplasmic protein [Deltaproteobacteria bacterium]|nr:putative periplasmic protein [Deltaproteobacteria bacterium]